MTATRTSRKSAYREFLLSEFWIAMSLARRTAIGKCQRCRSRKHLQCHHRIYRTDWYDTRPEDLEVLCRKCHRIEHGIWPFMIFRDDLRFSAIVHRIDCLIDRIVKGGSLRPRDDRFLVQALREYPTTKDDRCMEFKTSLVRRYQKMREEGFLWR